MTDEITNADILRLLRKMSAQEEKTGHTSDISNVLLKMAVGLLVPITLGAGALLLQLKQDAAVTHVEIKALQVSLEKFTAAPRFDFEDYIKANAPLAQRVVANEDALKARSTWMADQERKITILERDVALLSDRVSRQNAGASVSE